MPEPAWSPPHDRTINGSELATSDARTGTTNPVADHFGSGDPTGPDGPSHSGLPSRSHPRPAGHGMTELPGEPAAEVVELATRLFGHARTGATKALADYVAAGVPPNLANETGDTLIMLAAYHGHAETVRALLAAGADPDRPNDRGQTPLAGAVFKGETAVVKALVDGGADPTAGQPSAVDTARMFGRTDLLAIFEQHPPTS